MKPRPLYAIRILTLVVLMFGVASPAVLRAQSTQDDETAYISELTDIELEISDGQLEISDSNLNEVDSRTTIETVSLGSDRLFVQVAWLESTATADEFMDLLIEVNSGDFDDVSEITSGSEDGVEWRLFGVSLTGIEAYLLIEVTEGVARGTDQAVILASPDLTFLDELDRVQREVTLNGEPMLAGIDVDALEAAIEGEPQETSEPTTESTPEETEEASSGDPRAGARLGDDEDEPTEEAVPTEEDEPTEEVEATEEATTTEPPADVQAQLEEAGLVDETTYVSPQFGVEVTWDGDVWYADEDDERTASSNTEEEVDTLALIRDDSSGLAMIFIDVVADNGWVAQDYVDYWSSEEYLKPGEELIESRVRGLNGAVLFTSTLDSGIDVIVLREMVDLGDGNIALIYFIAPPEAFADAYADAEELVAVEGDAAVQVFTHRQIESATEP